MAVAHDYASKVDLINDVLQRCRQNTIQEINPNSADPFTAFISKRIDGIIMRSLLLNRKEWTFAHSKPIELEYSDVSQLPKYETVWNVPAAQDYIKVTDVFLSKKKENVFGEPLTYTVLSDHNIHTNYKDREDHYETGDLLATVKFIPEVPTWPAEFCLIVERMLEGTILRYYSHSFKEETERLQLASSYAAMADEKAAEDTEPTVIWDGYKINQWWA